jgi:hypothetical protein
MPRTRVRVARTEKTKKWLIVNSTSSRKMFIASNCEVDPDA